MEKQIDKSDFYFIEALTAKIIKLRSPTKALPDDRQWTIPSRKQLSSFSLLMMVSNEWRV